MSAEPIEIVDDPSRTEIRSAWADDEQSIDECDDFEKRDFEPAIEEDELENVDHARKPRSLGPVATRLDAPTDWPAPPDEQAFHGLAGRIVRAIEPHSEADLSRCSCRRS